MTIKSNYRILTLIGLSLCSAGGAYAQPDAGALQQQIENEQKVPLPGPRALEPSTVSASVTEGGVTLSVREFHFTGNSLLSSQVLSAAIADYVDRPINFSQIQAAATTIANVYREAGWVVRVFLPQQDILDGIVTIQIVEASFGKVVVDGQPKRLSAAQAVARIDAQQKAGQPVNTHAIDRGLLLADDLPGLNTTGYLRAGDVAGQTDLGLNLQDEALWAGAISADNTGSRSTGESRLSGRFYLNSALSYGEQISTQVIDSTGSNYFRLGASLPVGADGWRIGMNASRFDYRLVSSEFKSLKAEGVANSTGLEASYPLIRSRLRNLYFNTNFDHRTFKNTTVAGTTSDYNIRSGSFGLTGNMFDSWSGGGVTSASVVLTQGRVQLARLDLSEDRNLQGDFSKLRYSLSRQQRLTSLLSMSAVYSGQWSNDNLDSSEKMYLGGAAGVRAYPSNEGSGARGQMLNVDLRLQLPYNLSASTFYDWGRVTQNIDNRLLDAAENSYSLKGHGLSLGWQPGFGMSVQATWARRDGSNPNRSATGLDQDGSLDKNRWWLSANLLF